MFRGLQNPKVSSLEAELAAETEMAPLQRVSTVLDLYDQQNGTRYGQKSSQSTDCIASANYIQEQRNRKSLAGLHKMSD